MELITAKEAAKMLGVNVGTLATWRYKKRYDLGYVKVGKAVRYRRQDIHAFIAERTQNPLAAYAELRDTYTEVISH